MITFFFFFSLFFFMPTTRPVSLTTLCPLEARIFSVEDFGAEEKERGREKMLNKKY
jgi:hypothetical protein